MPVVTPPLVPNQKAPVVTTLVVRPRCQQPVVTTLVVPLQLLLVIAILVLAGCSPVRIPTAIPAAQVAKLSATATLRPSQTPTLAPTGTPTITPTDTPSPTPTASDTPTIKPTPTRAPVPTSGTITIKLYYIALNDGGRSGQKIGCDDSLVAVERTIPSTSAPLTAAVKELLSVRDRYYGQSGLYNSLYQSALKLDGVTIAGTKATIRLSGRPILSGECDPPRAIAQIRATALQFATVDQVAVYLGSVTIEQALSLKGG